MSSHETEDGPPWLTGCLVPPTALRARMQAAYVETEQSVFEALCELWPEANKASLRIAAMVSIGAMRVAKEAWRLDGGKQPMAKYLRESFATLEEIV